LIRNAEEKDLYPLCEMARRFVAETNLPVTFDLDITRNILWEGINNKDSILIVDTEDEIITGAVMGYMDRDFCKEYTAYLSKLYIEKEFRGLRVSLNLITAFEQATEKAKLTFTSATAGIDERVEKMYVRLFEKAGYSVLGRVLVKERK